MTIFISLCSQKGGVSKSTLARLVAREYANAGWSVKIADLDVSQGTSFSWAPSARDLLVAAGEQEDFHSFFAPQQPGAAFGNLTVSLSKKGHLLGHSPHPGGLFWRAAEAD